MSTRIALATLVLACSACVTDRTYQRQATFDEAEYLPYSQPGTASIAGQAFLKTRGGDVKYGAGNPVRLFPVTSCTTEWYVQGVIGGRRLSPSDPRAERFGWTVTADGEGRFTFSKLPAGSYYLACDIRWYVSDRNPQAGGIVHAKVAVQDGEALTNVILLP